MSNSKAVTASLVVITICAALAWAGAQGGISYGGVPVLVVCLIVSLLIHWAIFVPSFIWQTEHYFDLTGGIANLSVVVTAMLLVPGLDLRGLIIGLCIAIWAARLGTFLFLRIKKAGGDRRFDELKARFLRFQFTWTLSAAWVFITLAAGITAITSTRQVAPDLFLWLGLALWLFGFGFEVIADMQKTKFRADPANSGKFISVGLWSRSRHPNYFGEIVLWFGVAIMALPALGGWQYVTLVSPFFVLLLLTRISGVNMLEKSGEERWGSDPSYQQYVANTPALVPGFGKN